MSSLSTIVSKMELAKLIKGGSFTELHVRVMLLLTAFVIFASVAVSSWLSFREKAKRLPPGDHSWWADNTFPLLFNTKAGHSPYNLLRDLSRKYAAKNNGMFRCRLMGQPTVVVVGGDNFRSVLMRDLVTVTNNLPDQVKSLLGPEGVSMCADRERHKAIRMILVRHLSPAAVTEQYTETITATVQRHVEGWAAQPGPVLFYHESKKMAFDVLLASLFGFTYPRERLEQLMTAFETLEEGMWVCVPLKIPGFNYYRAHKARRVIYVEIDRLFAQFRTDLARRALDPTHTYKHTVLHSLLEWRFPEGSAYAGQGLTENELRDNAFGLLMGGFDTSATTMCMMMVLLSLVPETMTRLRAEQRAVRAQFGDAYSPEAIAAMPLTMACAKETLRIRTIGSALMRTCGEDMEVGGYLVPKGWMLYVSFELTHCRDAKLMDPADGLQFSHCTFSKEGFKPERWLDPETRPAEFYPFGAGVHQCAGMHLALREMGIFVATLARGYDFELTDKSLEWAPFIMPKFKSLVPIKFSAL